MGNRNRVVEAGKRPPAVVLWGLAGIAAMVVIGLFAGGGTARLDRWVYSWHLEPDSALGQVVAALSGLLVLASLLLLVVVAVRASWRRAGWVGLLVRHVVLLATFLAVVPLERLFRQPAPPVSGDVWSYPSGHASLATAAAVTAVVLCRAYLRSWRVPVLVVQVAAVGLTMLGRVVIGEHYVADVVGAVAGIVGIGLLAAVLLGLLPAHRGQGSQGVPVNT